MHRRRGGAEFTRTWPITRLLSACCASLVAGFVGLSQPVAAADQIRTAALTPGTEIPRDAELPTQLSGADASRYRQIFKLQSEGNWAAADTEIAALKDRTLLGHVLAQRYLHRRWKSRYGDLQQWLAAYPDLPDAQDIFELARRKRPAHTTAPEKPTALPVPLRGTAQGTADLRPTRVAAGAVPPASPGAALRAEIKLAARTSPEQAEHMLREADGQKLLDDAEYDDVRADIAEAFFFAGNDRQALILAATTRTPAYRPLAHWIAGLAAWRLNRLTEARTHFETLARMPNVSSWRVSAAAYWASRVHLRARRPQLVNYWLGIAAEHPRTFYGLIARRSLGIETFVNREAEPFTEIDARIVDETPAGHRALALLQVGETERAEMELRVLAGQAPAAMLPSLVAFADRANMPALSLQLAAMLSDLDGRRHDHALYPLPRWEPRGGFSVDRALLFALMRQESEFLPDARSPKGALGLMQLMPETAQAMAERVGLKLKPKERLSNRLLDPETNLTLAQAFVDYLLHHEKIKGSLFLVAAAYNGGPGNMLRWRTQGDYRDDPLLFLESMPSRETRAFVERVLANYWIYRLRLGQDVPDLEALASGEWPVYVALDRTTTPTNRIARSASAR